MSRFSLSIGTKIFGVATSMLALLLGVTYINHRNISLVNNELIDLSQYLTPLTEDVAQINVHALEQEIHYERVLRLLTRDDSDPALIASELAQFEERGQLVDQELEEAIALAQAGIKNATQPQDVLEFARVEPLLEVLEVDHQTFHEQSIEILDLIQAGDLETAEILEAQLEDFEDRFDQRIQAVLFELGAVTEASAHSAEHHEQQAIRASWLLAAIATGVGLTFASLVTLGLVQPIRRLVDSATEVDQGNLQVQVPVTSGDEVGLLSKSFNTMVADIQAKEQLKATFGQYVDPRIVDQLISQPGENGASALATTGGTHTTQRQPMTVFFSDIAGFSSISEMLTPSGLVTLINQYLTLASEPIVFNNGVIKQFIGDAVSAFWGEPFVAADEHAKLACYAALEQQGQLMKLRRILPDIMGIRKGLPEVKIRIGLATGELVASNIGSETSKSYTVLGPAVHIAEFLETTNKRYGTTILMMAGTQKAAGDGFETREIDTLYLPGHDRPTAIYELLDTVGNLTEQQETLRDRFQQGLTHYRQQEWDLAQTYFEACGAIAPNDGPTHVFLERVAYLRAHPPEPDWDGIWPET
ncbi:MAG: HAMP domain-containing protein [Merismopedia sp. SIO2A8]|nr:HAMP domain-containing protein [Merismopedia sp. SIO2A8]